MSGQDKDGDDEADRLAKLRAEQGTRWEFQHQWLPTSPYHDVCAVTRRQARDRTDDPQASSEILRPGRKPDDADLVAMQKQDPDVCFVRELVSGSPQAEPPPTPPNDSKTLAALCRDLPYLKLENGLLVYLRDGQGMPRSVVPTDRRGVILSYAHDTPVGGHRGYHATLDILKQVAYWSGLGRDTQNYAQGCHTCFRYAQPTGR